MNHQHEPLIHLDSVRLADAAVTGNKAAVLGELAHLGENVPDGYCLTTGPFQTLLASLVRPRAANRHWQKLAEEIRDSSLPADLSRALSNSLPKIRPASP